MKVIEVRYTVKGGRTLRIVGYHPDRMDLVVEWLAAMQNKLAYLSISQFEEMEAPFYRIYRVRRTKDGKRWKILDALPF